MKRELTTIALIGCMTAGAAAVRADIPKPDGIIYGELRVDGAEVTRSDAQAVLARVSGMDDPVAVYRMGERPAMGDRFVLHMPHAVQRDGHTASSKTAPAGSTASLYVVTTGGREVFIADVAVPASGQVVALDLAVSPGDLGPGAPAAQPEAQGCGAGSGLCGSTGLVSLALMFASLVQMKRRRRK